MNYPPEYNRYSDTIAEEILRNDSLSDDGKLARIIEHYKNRLLITGSLAEQVSTQEKEINEEIRYAEEKIRTAFENYRSSYENEPAFNISMQPIRLRQQALAIALAAIINHVEATISLAGQHVFDEARRLNWTVDQIEEQHNQLIENSRAYLSSIHQNYDDRILVHTMIFPLIFGIIIIVLTSLSSSERTVMSVLLLSTFIMIIMSILYSFFFTGNLFYTLIIYGFKWNKALSFTEDYAQQARKNIRRASKKIVGYGVALLFAQLVWLLSLFVVATATTTTTSGILTSGILLTTMGSFFLIRRSIKFFFN